MRNSFSKKKSNKSLNRKRGGCSLCKRKSRKIKSKMYGGNCTTEAQDLNTPIYERNTSMLPYRN
jgi:hypothetical protein